MMVAGPAALVFGGLSLLFGAGSLGLGSVDSSPNKAATPPQCSVGQGPIHNPKVLLMH
jgi:hypothetical protein